MLGKPQLFNTSTKIPNKITLRLVTHVIRFPAFIKLSCIYCCYLAPTVLCLVTQSCPTLSDPMDCMYVAYQAPLSMGIIQARRVEWVAMPFSKGSFQPRDRTQVSLIARQILYHLSHQGILRILEWVAYPFSRRSSWAMNQTGVSCIAGGVSNSWASMEAHLLL